MIYIYDILLNFNTSLIEFFEWEENDLIKYVKKLPIYKVSDDFLYNLKKKVKNLNIALY